MEALTSLSEAVDRVRARLPLLETGVALNHAGIGPQPIAAAVNRFEASRAHALPADALGVVAGCRARVRELYAQMLSVRPPEIAVTKNTAEGVNFIAQGFPWKSGDRVLTISVEYPSNVYPWWNLKPRGVAVDTVPERDGRVDYAELEKAITPRTRILAVSHVEFASGFAFDIDRLAAIASSHGLFLFLDIAQSIGAIHVDLSKVDAAAWPTWKWLMGPLGMGGFYLASKHLETIAPPFVGSDGMVPSTDYLQYDFRFRPDASRFEYSTENLVGLLGTRAALELLAPLWDRPAEISALILQNCDAVIARMEALGFQLYSSRNPGERSGILSFTSGDGAPDPGAAQAKLKHARIEAAVRGGRLRVSPHFYNTDRDFTRLTEALVR